MTTKTKGGWLRGQTFISPTGRRYFIDSNGVAHRAQPGSPIAKLQEATDETEQVHQPTATVTPEPAPERRSWSRDRLDEIEAQAKAREAHKASRPLGRVERLDDLLKDFL